MNRPDDTLPTRQLRATAAASWSERNQRWLARRFNYWTERLASAETVANPPVDPAVDEVAPRDFEPAALRLTRIFALSEFETELIVLLVGLETDAGLRAALARAQGINQGAPLPLGYDMALALLPGAHWDAISPTAPLRRWFLISLDTRVGLLKAQLRIDERVLHFVTGVDTLDERLAGIAHRLEPESVNRIETQLAVRVAAVAGPSRDPLVILGYPAHDPACRASARRVAIESLRQLHLRTLWLEPAALPGDPRKLDEIARHIDRETALGDFGLVVAGAGEFGAGSLLARLLARLGGPIIVLGEFSALLLADLPRRVPLRFALNMPQAEMSQMSQALSPALQRAAARAMQQFRVEPALLAQSLASVAALEDPAQLDAALWSSLRELARGGLDALAQRIETRASFDDLVVPPFVSAQLREIASQLRHRTQVYEDWGFGGLGARGLGISALFAGESGTGKTLAAEAIANEAGLDLYRVDLAATVSKYIGETEKNLARLFDAAERSGAVLLFDEADALFGQRSEVRDSHDRYANIEVAYLLQRIESYRGLAILTTNMKAALDRAFLRRIRFVVQFPFPDARMREAIWRRQFPSAAPTESLDYVALARPQLAGGNIHSIVINAAFRAAAEAQPINQRHLSDAIRVEHAKLDRTFAEQPGACK